MSRNRRYSDYQVDIQDAEQVENAPQLKGIDTPEYMLINDEIVAVIKLAIEKLPEEMKIANYVERI